jgi:hypothetical protein
MDIIFAHFFAECSHDGTEDAITIWELLGPPGQEAANQCRWSWGNPPTDVLTVPSQDCVSLAYGKDCGKITSEVNLMFAVLESWNNDTARSRMDEFLQRLGIGNVTEMTDCLRVTNVGVNLDANLTLNVFSKLQRVDAVYITGSTLQSTPDVPRSLVGFPGFRQIEQTKMLVLDTTSLTGLTDFGGLKCVGSVSMITNTRLDSLAGIQNVRVGIEELTLADYLLAGSPNFFELRNNLLIRGVGDLLPLSQMAGCEGGPTPSSTLGIDILCLDSVNSWPTLCGILQNRDCNARPPAPPPPPPPPPDPPTPPDPPLSPDSPEAV